MKANRIRAGAACQHCHSRKAKCDAQEKGTPCKACRDRGFADCRIMPSSRGKYVRRGRKPLVTVQSDFSHVSATSSRASPAIQAADSSHLEEQLQSGISGIKQTYPNVRPDSGRSPASCSGSVVDPNPPASLTDDGPDDKPSWVDLFETFLRASGHKFEIEKTSINYLGESFPLMAIAESLDAGGRLQLHHPAPIKPTALVTSPGDSNNAPHLRPDEFAFLKARDVFTLPPTQLLDRLMSVFIDKVYPFYPVVNLPDFVQHWQSKSLPWIIFHAVCFISSNFCPLQILHSHGFPTRKDALDLFYGKAKLLFDFGYERDKLVLLQCATLLTFWPSSPTDLWTFYHWVSFAVTLAESMGTHRSMKHLDMAGKDRSLLKRIWWVLVVRDAFGAALFGRPPRINEIHCDVEFVEEEDFEEDRSLSQQNLFDPINGLFFAQVSRLAVILRRIMTNRLGKGDEAVQGRPIPQRVLLLMLEEWRLSVPPPLDWDESSSARSTPVAALSILYDSALICVNMRKYPPSDPASLEAQPTGDLSAASHEAAERIINVGSQLMTTGALTTMPHEIFTGIFVAEVVSYTQVSNSNSNIAKLARAQVSRCQMLFHETRDFWDPSSWILQLFNILLAKGRHCSQDNGLDKGLFSFDFLSSATLFNEWDDLLGIPVDYGSFNEPTGS